MEKFLTVLLKWLGVSAIICAVIFVFGLIQENFVNKGLLDWIFDDGGIFFVAIGLLGLFVYMYIKED